MVKEPLIPYALKGNRIVYIDDVDRGRACGCTCPKCGQRLQARKGIIREHHFSHDGDKPCKGAYEETMHRLAIQILQDEKCVMAPPYKNVVPSRLLRFERVETEVRSLGNGIRPDVVGTCADGTTICIEVRCTHAVDEDKLHKIIGQGLNCLEIDIREHRMDETELRRFLLSSAEDRKWLNHPEYERLYQEKEAEREAQRQKDEAERRRKQKEIEERRAAQLSKIQAQAGASKPIIPLVGEEEPKEPVREREIVPHPAIGLLQDGPLKDYYERLHPHDIFKEYTEEKTVVVNLGLSYSRRAIFVIHVNKPYKDVRLPFHLSRITFEGSRLVHEHIGAYRNEKMAEKTQLQLKDDVSKL